MSRHEKGEKVMRKFLAAAVALAFAQAGQAADIEAGKVKVDRKSVV